MTKWSRAFFASSLFILGATLVAAQDTSPERPAIDRDVHMTETAPGETRPRYTRPTIPTLQTTADGRIGVSNELAEDGRFAFRLLVPENISSPFMTSAPGTEILAFPDSLVPDEAALDNDEVAGRGLHHTMCDPAYDPKSQVKNPSPCGLNGRDDCYRVSIIRTGVDENDEARLVLWATAIKIRVENPKTVDARIAEITVGAQRQGHSFAFPKFFEPMTIGDGRLLMVRASSDNEMTWTNSLGEVVTTTSDNIYLVNDDPDAHAPCDVTQWDKAYPLSHAPYDNTINQRYGFAMQLFRNPNNTVIAEDTPMSSYPWVDKGGDNISMVMHGENLYDTQTGESDYETRCVVPADECADDLEAQFSARINGRVIMGLWTRGKMVMTDDLVNNTDFTLRGDEPSHREVKLYQAIGGDDGFTRVANGRDNRDELMPEASSGNTTFFDTLEHRFNFHRSFFPITPRDVTWLVSSGRGTDELPFDDYTDPNSFIHANMTHVVEFRETGSRRTIDGQIQNTATGGRVLAPENAAFEEAEWVIPTHGDILGNGRVESVAKGGVHGKGFWSDGEGGGLSFAVPSQARDVAASDWYYGFFVDIRDDVAGDIALISFPDDSQVSLRNGNRIILRDSQNVEVHSIDTRSDLRHGEWAHIGLQMTDGNTTITTFVNGYRVDTFVSPDPLLQIVEGDLQIGVSQDLGAARHFRGWIDDFKVMADSVNPEVACNQAGGTLAGISGAPDTQWLDLADRQPQESHDLLRDLLTGTGQTAYSQYVCFHDYTDDFAAHLQNIPAGLTGIRDSVNFPEGPIFRDRPRPDSAQNRFCLSCHTSGGMAGLGLDAIAFDSSVTAPFDPRRQPTQPPARVFGNIPADWLGDGVPGQHRVANPEVGFPIDWLLLPDSTD